MSNFMLMEPTNQTFQELIGNGMKYSVPKFQRDYAWKLEQWEELWSDIKTLDEEHYHYMGYMVLQRKGQYDFEVIDGQQRLVTLSLVVLAGMKQIQTLVQQGVDTAENTERLQVLTDRFIGSKNAVSLKVDNKLSLNRNNGTHFKAICSNLDAPNRRNLTATNKLLHQAFQFYAKNSMGKTGEEIAQFIEKLTSGMIFTKIVVQDELNAYKIFETLNARGVQLSTPDLLKNYIFSIVTKNEDVSNQELDDLDENWSEVILQLGESNFTDFIRYHHNFQKNLVTKKGLFSSIRQLITTPKLAYSYLNSLTQYAPIYASLLNPYDEWWANQGSDYYRQVRKHLEGISIFNIKQPLTIFMAAFSQFTPEEFVKTVKYLYVLSIRYNVVCHHSPSDQEKNYNQIAMKIYLGKYKRASHVKNSPEYKKLYPDDKTFSNAFEFHKMPSRQSTKKIRCLLSDIEETLGHKTDYLKTTLEHICPYHPEQEWAKDFGEGVSDVQDRLGNLILLEKDALKRQSFADKKIFYAQSTFKLALKIAEYDTWDLKMLNDYQKWLSDQAVITWRVDL